MSIRYFSPLDGVNGRFYKVARDFLCNWPEVEKCFCRYPAFTTLPFQAPLPVFAQIAELTAMAIT